MRLIASTPNGTDRLDAKHDQGSNKRHGMALQQRDDGGEKAHDIIELQGEALVTGGGVHGQRDEGLLELCVEIDDAQREDDDDG